ARDVHRATVHLHVPVPNQLARSLAARSEAQPVHDVVQPRLQPDEQVLARHALLPRSFLEQVLEVLLRHTVDAADLLLLTQLLRVVRRLPTPRLRQSVLPRRIVAPIHRAFLRVALGPLQKQLLPLAPAELADRTRIASHALPSLLVGSFFETSSRPDGL